MGVIVRFDKDGNPDIKEVDITHSVKPNHHRLVEIFDRVEAAEKAKLNEGRDQVEGANGSYQIRS